MVPFAPEYRISPVDGTIYASTGAGIFKVAGNTWTALPGAGTAGYVVADPLRPNTVSASDFASPSCGCAFKSTDGGETWHEVGLWHGFPVGDGPRVVDPGNSNYVYAIGSENGLFRSTDGAATWTRVIPDAVSSVVVSESKPHILYACVEGVIERSANLGASWSRLKTPQNASGPLQCGSSLAVSARSSAAAYAVLANAGGAVLSRTTDSGRTWSIINTRIPYLEQNDPSEIRGLFTAPEGIAIATAGLGVYLGK